MEIFKIENLSFTYPLNNEKRVLDNINLNINSGEFVVLCGKSGCGKTTLIKQLKPSLTPHGILEGDVFYKNQLIKNLDLRSEASKIGYVFQNPDNQIVTDKVWHELAFGLESLGYDNEVIRVRVCEMASYFGIEKWFYKNVTELSGGQKQLLNLASIMAMNPKVLLLDEPTSQLDPIAASEFLETIKKINLDFGITIIISEHRLEEVFPMADKVIVMEDGKIIGNNTPRNIGKCIKNNAMYLGLPTSVRLHMELDDKGECPITIREGKEWLEKLFKNKEVKYKVIEKEHNINEEIILELKGLYFKYEKQGEDIIKDLNLKVHKGEFYSIVGGNGSGKTTALSLMSTLNKPYRGKVILRGKDINKYSYKELFDNNLGVLPQNPQSIFVKKTVKEDLIEMLVYLKIKKDEKEERVKAIARELEIEDLLLKHPYDLSGGEQQKTALAKILLLNPSILLLDEPTKGLDNYYKRKLGQLLKKLQKKGITIIMVTHDIEFAAEYSDTCGMFFQGTIICSNTPKKFFGENQFYTTSANKISRGIFNNLVTCDEVIEMCKKNNNYLY